MSPISLTLIESWSSYTVVVDELQGRQIKNIRVAGTVESNQETFLNFNTFGTTGT